MSNYKTYGRDPRTKKEAVVMVIQNYFGTDRPGVRFPDGVIFRGEMVSGLELKSS